MTVLLASLLPCRTLWLAISGDGWLPESHCHYSPAFRAAAKALLLAQHRLSRAPEAEGEGSAAASGLGLLPAEMLWHILALAACPVSAWM